MDYSYYHYIQADRNYPQRYGGVQNRPALTHDESRGERRKENQQNQNPIDPERQQSLKNGGQGQRKYSHFFFKSQLHESPEEKFPEKMEWKGDEYLKNEKDRETADNEGRNGKLSAVFGMKKKKIVDENKKSDSD